MSEFEKIRGHRTDSTLYWIPEEKFLYVKKEERGNKIECICYQTVLTNSNRKVDRKKCTARRFINSKGQISKSAISHTNHDNHELIYKDLITRKSIVDTCVGVQNLLGDISVKVSVGDIFTREIAK